MTPWTGICMKEYWVPSTASHTPQALLVVAQKENNFRITRGP